VTIFTTCKPFSGISKIHQGNALRSWAILGLDVIILGDEPGVAEICKEIGATHIKDVIRSSENLPLINDLFRKAEQNSSTQYLAYLNSDIILLPDFLDTVNVLAKHKQSNTPRLLTARRYNIPLNEEIDFASPTYTNRLVDLKDLTGSWDHPFAIDMFLYSRDLFQELPTFSVGRPQWDNWMLGEAIRQKSNLIDCSDTCTLLHPIHGYGGNWEEVTFGKSARHNKELGNFISHNIEDSCTHFIETDTIIALTKDRRTIIAEKCKPNILNEFASALGFFTQAPPEKQTEIVDDLKSIFWRLQLFFPLQPILQVNVEHVCNHLKHAKDLCKTHSPQKALLHLQDILAYVFLQKLQQAVELKHPLFIWGAGQYGLRLYDLLSRHNIPIEAFIDKNQHKIQSGTAPLKVQGKDILHEQRGKGAIIIIASMHFKEIIEEAKKLNIYGYYY